MLTQNELEWLHVRKQRSALCDKDVPADICAICTNYFGCPLEPDCRDALEFSERVIKWLLRHDYNELPCASCPIPRFVTHSCGEWCLLRLAHLTVKQEMEKVNKYDLVNSLWAVRMALHDVRPADSHSNENLNRAHKLLKELISTYGAEGGEVNAEFGKN